MKISVIRTKQPQSRRSLRYDPPGTVRAVRRGSAGGGRGARSHQHRSDIARALKALGSYLKPVFLDGPKSSPGRNPL